MPGKKNQRQSKKAKRGKRGKGGAVTGFNPVAGLFPERWFGKMTYGVSFAFPTIAASSMALTVLRLNSVYDPDFSGAGTAAAGYASAVSIYGRYRVVAADVEVEASLTGNYGLQFIAVASNDSTLGTSYAAAVAQRHFYGKSIPYGGPAVKQKFHVPIHTVYGVPKAQVLAEDDFAALPSGSPNNQVFLHVGAFNPNAAAASMVVTIRVVYHVFWSLPLYITQP